MFNHIIVAVDGSQHSMAAAALAAHIATRSGARLEAVYVKDSGLINAPYWRDFGPIALPTMRFNDELDAFFQARGEAVLETLRARHPGLTGTILTGRPDKVIPLAARDADLVAVGAAGESHEESGDMHLGAKVERFIRRIHAPVLVAPTSAAPLTRVLLALGPAFTGEAVAGATDLAGVLGLPIEVIALGQGETAGEAHVRAVLADHGLGSVPLAGLPGKPADGLRSSVRPGDLVVASDEDFFEDFDQVAARLEVPLVSYL